MASLGNSPTINDRPSQRRSDSAGEFAERTGLREDCVAGMSREDTMKRLFSIHTHFDFRIFRQGVGGLE